jgi:hypothetical protein
MFDHILYHFLKHQAYPTTQPHCNSYAQCAGAKYDGVQEQNIGTSNTDQPSTFIKQQRARNLVFLNFQMLHCIYAVFCKLSEAWCY